MNKVLITGAGGFIGRALGKKCKENGWQLIGMTTSEGDVANINTWDEVRGKGVTCLFHLAGRIFVPDSWENPFAYYQTNAMGTVAALEFCRQEEIPITYVSSYLYGNPSCLPVSENNELKPNNPYAHSKYLAEDICRFYASVFNVDVTIVRPFNVYGEGQPKSLLIPSVIDQVLHAKQIKVMDLIPRRDYVHVDDLVDALIATVGGSHGLRVYNIGSGRSYSVAEVIDLIQKCAGTKKIVVSEKTERLNEIEDVIADCTRAKKELGWECRISFEQGISRLIKAEERNERA